MNDIQAVQKPHAFSELSYRLIGCAIEVHRNLGPGLLESAYCGCLLHELARAGIHAECEVPIPVVYKGHALECGFRADMLVENEILLELKSVERLQPIHEAQLLTYLRLTGLHLGFLLNFNSVPLKSGIRRFVN